MIYKYTRFQKLSIAWLTVFTIVCFVNSILVIKYECWSWNRYFLAFLLPFAHLGLIVILSMGYGAYLWFFTDRQLTDPDSEYIKCHYPHIWKRLHPYGDLSGNFLALAAFIRNKYDDGTDETLNKIKFRVKVNQNLIAWPVCLTIIIWLFSFALMVWYGRFGP